MAKSKTQRTPRGNSSVEHNDERNVEANDRSAPMTDSDDQPNPGPPLPPVKPQPWLFKISVALFIAWLCYLGYVAYKVLF